ncbi:MAG: single-stranded DNA-binding protein [Phycisphaerales bacterium]|nr:single-stranded DNA-binding protein [Phycisphaerales bacterium]
MASFNRVILMGNLTRDIELKQLASGQSVAKFGLAVNNKFKTKDGELKEEVTFVDCEAWGRQAEVMKQYLTKGRPVLIEGRLKLDQWEDKDQQKRSKLFVVVENFQFVGAREGAGSGGGGGSGDHGSSEAGSRYSSGSADSSRSNSPQIEHTPVGETEIPF